MTRTMLLAVLCLLALAPTVHAQRGRPVELSLSATAGAMTHSGTERVSVGDWTTTYPLADDQTFVTLAVRPGIFLSSSISFEPELLWTAREGAPPVFQLSGNLLYTIRVPRARVQPFVLAGIGYGNGIPTMGRLTDRLLSNWEIRTLNAGAGLRFLLSDRTALRTEYRFQYQTWDHSSTSGTVKYAIDAIWRQHLLLVGVSVFVP